MLRAIRRLLNRKPRSRPAPARRTRLTLELLEARELLAQLTFLTQPLGTATGLTLNPITVSSSAGGKVPITISLGNNQSGLQLEGTVTKDTDNGKITFDDLVLFGGSGENSKDLVLIASSGTDSATSNSFVVKPGADHLLIAPLSTHAAGDNLGPVTVQVLDADGALTRSDSTTQVRLYIDHNPGGAQFIGAGPFTATVNQGVATFPDVRLDKAGVGYTLGVQALNNPLLPQFTSNAFVVTAAQASGLAFVNQPTYSGITDTINVYNQPGNSFHYWTGVTAQVVDKFGDPVAGPSAGLSSTTLSAAVSGSAKTLTVAGTAGFPTAGPFSLQVGGEQMTVTAVAGNTWTVTRGVNYNPVIIPTNLSAGITDSATTLTVFPAGTFPTAAPFNIQIDNEVMTVTAGAGTTTWTVTRGAEGTTKAAHDLNAQVRATTQAAHAAGGKVQLLSIGTATVAAFDASGKPVSFVPGSTTTVPIDGNGLAAFTNLRIDKQGNDYTLQVTGALQGNGQTDLTGATSSKFNLGPARGRLVVDPQAPIPGTAQMGVTLAPIKVDVIDAAGNVITADNTDKIYLAGGNWNGTRTVTVQNGVATFDDLEINPHALPDGGFNATFQFADLVGFGGPIVQPIGLQPGKPYRLSFDNRFIHTAGQSPGTATASEYLQDANNHPITVHVVDQAGNQINNTRLTKTGGTTAADPKKISVSDTSGLSVGMVGQGNGVPGPTVVNNVPTYTVITDIDPTNHVITVSNKTTVASGTTLTFDPNILVSLGVLPTQGRGAVFLGRSDTAGDLQGLSADVEVLAVNGLAVFDKVYVNYVGRSYILAASTASFATNGLETTDSVKGFDVVPNKAVALTFPGNDKGENVLGSVDQNRLNAANPVISPFANVNGVVVEAVDKGGNVDTSFNGPITLDLKSGTGDLLAGGTNSTPAKGPITVNARNGVAVFNMAAIRNGTPDTAQPFQLKATSASLPGVEADSNTFQVSATQRFPGVPGVKFDGPIANQKQGQPFQVTVDVLNGGALTSDYDKLAHVLVELRDPDGNPLPNDPAGPVLVGDQSKNTPDHGKVTFTFTLQQVPAGGRLFTLLALLDLNAQTVLSNVFSDPPPASPPGADAGAPPPVVQVGLGSYTQNFNQIKDSPTWQNIPAGKRPYPPSVQFDPAVAQDPKMQQPNVADGFNQVPVSTKWWSSLIFPRTQADVAGKLPRDSQGNQLYPLFAEPFAATVNSNGSGAYDSPNDFAGLGLSYLDNLFITQTTQFADPTVPNIPPGQPPSWENPQYPGAVGFEYPYGGNGDQRLYQDFSVGLQGVKAVGKVLRYSDSTVTLDWAGRLQATLGERLPYVYFTAPNANGATFQLVTSPKVDGEDPNKLNPVTITVTDPSGNRTGPLMVEIKYQTHDTRDKPQSGPWPLRTVDHFYGIFLPAGATRQLSADSSTLTFQLPPQATQTGGTTLGSTVISVQNASALAVGMGVTGPGVPPNAVITSINAQMDQVTLSAAATATASGVTLTFDRNYFSVATLPDGSTSTFNFYRQRAYSFVTGSSSSFTFDQSTGKVTTTYTLQTQVRQTGGDLIDNRPLQALYVTQSNNLSAHDQPLLTNLSYVSARGTMKVWDGPVFHTVLQYQGALPAVAPLPEDGTSHADLWRNYLLPILQGISNQAQSDGRLVLDQIFPNDNNYLEAQSMFGASQLVPILLEISQSKDAGLSANDRAQAASYAEQIFNQVKDRMSAWLSAQDDSALKLLYYQPSTPLESGAPANSKGWESLMSILSGFLSSESLNDHQLIGGYFIKTAAFLAQYDPTWGDHALAFDDGKKDLQGKLGDVIKLMITSTVGVIPVDLPSAAASG
jgi:hypothetical protein